jgi:hypothetical protein
MNIIIFATDSNPLLNGVKKRPVLKVLG